MKRFESLTKFIGALESGLIGKILDGVKILGGGELTKKLTVSVDKVTASAKEKIEANGGKVEVK